MLLVEQNATMALSIASHGYVMENGKIVLDKPAAELLGRRGRARVLPRPARRGRGEVVPRRQALQAAQAVAVMTRRPSGPSSRRSRRRCWIRRCRLSFAGVKAIDGVSLHGRRQRAVRDHRPERRRQDLDLQRALRGVPAAVRPGHSSTAPISSAGVPHEIAAARDGPHVPERRAVRQPDRAGQPDARPPPPPRATARSPRSPGSARRGGASSPTGRRSRTSSTSSSWSSGGGCRSACCPTACRSGSSSAARWPWSPSCCCSTSRWPA